jgi:hypothetical protein
MKDPTEATDITASILTEDTVLDILSPNGTPTGWKITLAGPSNPKASAFADVTARRNLHKAKLIEQAQVNGKKYQAEEKTPEEQRRDNVQFVISRILDWTPVKIGGEVYTFSDKTAETLLMKPEMINIYVQILEAINEERRFTKPSVTS